MTPRDDRGRFVSPDIHAANLLLTKAVTHARAGLAADIRADVVPMLRAAEISAGLLLGSER